MISKSVSFCKGGVADVALILLSKFIILCVLLARLTAKNKHRNQKRLIVVQFFGTPDAIRTHDT